VDKAGWKWFLPLLSNQGFILKRPRPILGWFKFDSISLVISGFIIGYLFQFFFKKTKEIREPNIGLI